MHTPRKIAVTLLAGVSVAGMAGAAAATLGGLTAGQLGSEDQVVAACDLDGITAGYTTTYNATAQKYQVTAVNFTNVNPLCNGKAASVTLRNGITALSSQSSAAITVATNAFSLTLTTPADASAVTGLSVIISG